MDTARLVIRPAKPPDHAAIAALHIRSWQAAYAGTLPDAVLARDVPEGLTARWHSYTPQDRDLVLVARDAAADGPLLGFAAVWCRPQPYLDNLHVAPAARGRGVGRALMREIARHLTARGEHTLSLMVFEDNRSARAFYARLGGRETDRCDERPFGHRVTGVRVAWDDLTALL
ncbi:GNAT family N-acetyltransferase [Stappia sp.]|uniref:GNAT family N-acetyltransferase n=1 Tax=Stappia sp. TaxID=1870903 RepID=UPI0032D9257C